jgi:RecA-family ATPase
LKPVLDRDYVIKDWLDRNSASVVYGEANVGKSFWAVDVAHHVQEGLPWGGCRVRPGPVLYCAAEGGALFDNRLAARGAGFMMLRGALTMTGRNSDAEALTQAVLHLTEIHGGFALIIIDTLARVMGGADENSAPDIGALMRGVDILRERTGAHIMLIHHPGKEVGRGARGHSSLRAAIDTEIELTRGEHGERLARATKQRDMALGTECRFDLEIVTLGHDRDGDAVTSCIVKHKDGGRA